MPVNISPLLPEQLLPVDGVTLGIAEAGIKKPNRKELLVMLLDEVTTAVEGVLTGPASVLARGYSIDSRTMKAGDLFYIGPGHDSWVVGDEPYVSLHFLGAEHYAAAQGN